MEVSGDAGESQKIILNLLHPEQHQQQDEENNSDKGYEAVEPVTYGTISGSTPVDNQFLPLSGGDDLGLWNPDDYDTAEVDPNRPSANTLIYLCALCSSLTSVLLGYGERKLCK